MVDKILEEMKLLSLLRFQSELGNFLFLSQFALFWFLFVCCFVFVCFFLRIKKCWGGARTIEQMLSEWVERGCSLTFATFRPAILGREGSHSAAVQDAFKQKITCFNFFLWQFHIYMCVSLDHIYSTTTSLWREASFLRMWIHEQPRTGRPLKS